MQATMSTAAQSPMPPVRLAPALEDSDKEHLRARVRQLLDARIGVVAVLELAFTPPRPGAYDGWFADHVWDAEVREFLNLAAPQLAPGWQVAKTAGELYVVDAYYGTQVFKLVLPLLRKVAQSLSTEGIRAFARAATARAAQRSGLAALRAGYRTAASQSPGWLRSTGRFALRRALPVYLSYYSIDTLMSARDELIDRITLALVP